MEKDAKRTRRSKVNITHSILNVTANNKPATITHYDNDKIITQITIIKHNYQPQHKVTMAKSSTPES